MPPPHESPSLADAFPELSSRYRIEASLGRGGFGEVWQARDGVLDRPVAIKLITGCSDDEIARERWLTEARALAGIRHPNVVGIHDFGISNDGSAAYLVLEWIAGTTLAEELMNGPLDTRTALERFRKIADGLSALHQVGVVHRDLKPQNILIEQGTGRPVIIDLGAAIRTNADWAFRLTQTYESIGSAGYMPPEQQQAGYEPDPRTDQYALAVVLYQMLSGRLPAGAFPTVAKLRLLPTRPSTAVNRALDPEPNKRFPSVEEFVAEVHRKGRSRRVAVAAGVVALGVAAAAFVFMPDLRSSSAQGGASVLEWKAAPTLSFTGSWKSHLQRVESDPNGNIIGAGMIENRMGCLSWSNGVSAWKRQIVPDSFFGSAFDLRRLPGGDMVVAGKIDGPEKTWQDFVVSRIDGKTGEPRWLFRRDGGSGGNDEARRIVVSPDGKGIVAAGMVQSGEHSLRFHVVSFDANSGTVIWETDASRSELDSSATGVAFLPDGDLIVVGAIVVNGRSEDAFVSRLDGRDGTTQWLSTFGADGHETRDIALGVEIDEHGSPIVLATCGMDARGLMHPVVAKVDPGFGSFVWKHELPPGTATDFTVTGSTAFVAMTRKEPDDGWWTECHVMDIASGKGGPALFLESGTGVPMAAAVSVKGDMPAIVASGTSSGSVTIRTLDAGFHASPAWEAEGIAWPLPEPEWVGGLMLRTRLTPMGRSIVLSGQNPDDPKTSIVVLRVESGSR
ncbi:MAG: protein kinase [Verrucomicrobiae bacterium]|nr:protein kinase [Verrucomicrobiae bacterium]MCP5543146.1 protein kinase [Akkermansiaceae bacterium]